ncbi:MAG: translation elongation factor Ts [Candidatus Kapaibacterium sp.]
MAITLEDIKNLRERTGAGMADCKKALEEANGDMEGAIDILRKKGAATAAKRADKAADEGMIATAVADDHKSAAVVEINCETDFVARNAEFSTFAEKIANVVLQNNPASEAELLSAEIDGITVEAGLNELLAKFSERIGIRRFERIETNDGFISDYIHGGSRLAVLVELGSAGDDNDKSDRLARDIAMQVAAMNPAHVSRDEFTPEVIEKEREIYREQLAGENKPADIIEKIVNGRVEKFFEESTLLEQSFVKDSSKRIADVMKEHSEGATVRRFIRFNLGESLEEATSTEEA